MAKVDQYIVDDCLRRMKAAANDAERVRLVYEWVRTKRINVSEFNELLSFILQESK